MDDDESAELDRMAAMFRATGRFFSSLIAIVTTLVLWKTRQRKSA
jgi:hypothetical protein